MRAVYDIEVFKNFFSIAFFNLTTKKHITFVVFNHEYDSINELGDLYKYLEGITGLIGFNNIYYDRIILNMLLLKKDKLLKKDAEYIVGIIYKLNDRIIHGDGKYDKRYNKDFILQLDPYKILHLDNSAKRTSLKKYQIWSRFPNVQELPFPPGSTILLDQIPKIIKYGYNDVDSTLSIFNHVVSIGALELRKYINKIYGFECLNFNDVKIGEEINKHEYCKNTGKKYWEFRNLRTPREVLHVKDLFPSYIKFKTKYLQDFFEEIKTKSFDPNVKGDFMYELHIGNKHYNFAKGGLHSHDEAGIVNADNCQLREDDIGSMYPAGIINGKLYPKHLGIEWFQGIKGSSDKRIFEYKPRLKYLKSHKQSNTEEYKTLKTLVDALKLALNGGGYGKTNSEYSWQYDPLVTFTVTFTGQLSILMLIEDFVEAGIEIISANTDGVVSKVRPDQQEIYQKIKDDWMEITNYKLEATDYKKIIFSNVNNYIAQIIAIEGYKYEDMKFKGWFEIDKEIHKDSSNRVVALAIANYLINNIPVKDTIENHLTNGDYNIGGKTFKNYGLFDFCKTQNIGKEFECYYGGKKVQRLNRFIISQDGKIIYKKKKEYGRNAEKITPFRVTLFNDSSTDIKDINYPYYINESLKIIKPVIAKKIIISQLKMF